MVAINSLGNGEHYRCKHKLFHPSGDIIGSLEDINVRRRLVEAGKLLGIEVLDHFVVNSETFIFLIRM